eukprot:CAMPEP_0116891288 /NCGR_PEP_ID=MMETSP0467-20121206/1737_1 /TAXON_ID=283647 /ORGANISM="Mesodinium pulex, Strain SPMC105" /LENGTH=40 /DNA_ID= /DNA_START= /DNA_END= /DNA_ORIENTATION=
MLKYYFYSHGKWSLNSLSKIEFHYFFEKTLDLFKYVDTDK